MYKTIYYFLFVIFFIATGFKYVGENNFYDNNKFPGKLHCQNPSVFNNSIKEKKHIIEQTGGEQNKNDSIDQSWLSTAIENIKREEYNIVYNNHINSYESPNRKNNIDFTYHDDGFTAKTLMAKFPLFDVNDKTIKEKDKKYKKTQCWNIDFKLTGYSRTNTGSQLAGFTGTNINVDSNKVNIEDDNLRIDYANNEDGMRQDFTIKNKPEGNGELKLEVKVTTKLKMIIDSDALMFKNSSGKEIMKYSALKAFDATGKELRAYFKPSKNNKEFSIIVNEEDAQYPIIIDPLSSTPNWTAIGENVGDGFGYSVSTAGDVNGDGYSDVIVGVPYYSGGQGKAYVFYGNSTGLSTTPSWEANGENTGNNFGFSVSTAGDVNGDGFSEVIIGAIYYSGNKGKAYVYYGSATGLSTIPNWTVLGETTNNYFGYSVSTAGDVNGDGYADVIIGAYGYSSNKGKAYMYHGNSTGLSTTANWTTTGANTNDFFGWPVSTTGDVNGDGYTDVIIGSVGYSSNRGKAYVYYGSSTGLSATANWTVVGENNGDIFGSCVSAAGDVNGDGYSDVIIIARSYSSYKGKVYVYHGSSIGLSTSPNWTAMGENTGDYFGWSVSNAGDVNGDGYSDVIIGANCYSSFKGKAYVYYGSSTGLSTTPTWTTIGENTNDYFGYSVSTAGDVNGDGYSDVIIGAYCYSSWKGKAYVYYGSPTGLSATSNWTTQGENTYDQFGFSVSTAGDVNGDGYSDVIIGARYYLSNKGKAYVYYGSSLGLSSTPNWIGTGENNNDQFGFSVSTAGDVNGDGYSDVIIGARSYLSNKGKAYVYYGNSSGLSTTANWTAIGENTSDVFGVSVSSAGDVNGDGYSDVIIGAYGYSSGKGKAYIYYGSLTGLSTISNWTAVGENTSDLFGWSVSSAGDVNGDGYSDVIIGAYQYSSYRGKVYLFQGSSGGLSTTPNWTATGENTNNYFGNSVSTAGDVNGDGYSDVIISSFGYSSIGKVYVYHGSATGLSTTANWTTTGENTNDYFGYSVSTAGDVNGDGYSDVVIGAFDYSSVRGKAYVYHGSSTGLSVTPSWSTTGENTNDWFGYCVSTAGDVNGDGYSDVIIGANYYSSSRGKVYVYYGNGGTGKPSTLDQCRPSTSTVICPGDLSGTDGQVRLSMFSRSPFGRTKGKLVYEYEHEGVPFSGSIITNSTGYTGMSSSWTDLTTSGVTINNDISSIPTSHIYNWRVRVKYNPASNPYQVYGPWRYYKNFMPLPSGGFLAQNGPLPVNMNYFTYSINKNNVNLKWETSNEINNSGFEIQRMKTGVQNWAVIGWVKGNGTTNHPEDYTFDDNNLQKVNYQYRLRQVDYNGNFEYHALAGIVNVGAPIGFNVSQNYPNPSNPKTKIDYQIPFDGKVMLKVYDIAGREVATLVNEVKEAGYYTAEFDGTNLASGVYFYKIIAGDFVEVKKMILLK